MKKIGVIYTVPIMQKSFPKLIQQEFQDIELINILDKEILNWIAEDRYSVTKRQIERVQKYITELERKGVQTIISTCSSLGNIIDHITTNVPILRIDQAMMEKAVKVADKVVLVATAETTVSPSKNLLERSGEKIGKVVDVNILLLKSAGVLLFSGDTDGFIQKLIDEISQIENKEVIVLAQGSMAGAASALSLHFELPVLSSTHLFIEALHQHLGGRTNEFRAV